MYTEARIEAMVHEILKEQLNVNMDNDKFTSDLRIVDDLGADSLDIVEIIMTFEEAFDIEISEDDVRVTPIDTVGSAVDLVKSKIPNDKKRNF